MRNLPRDFGALASHHSQGADGSPRPEEELKMLLHVRTNSLRGLLP
jgi:hypothetical protein